MKWRIKLKKDYTHCRVQVARKWQLETLTDTAALLYLYVAHCATLRAGTRTTKQPENVAKLAKLDFKFNKT